MQLLEHMKTEYADMKAVQQQQQLLLERFANDAQVEGTSGTGSSSQSVTYHTSISLSALSLCPFCLGLALSPLSLSIPPPPL